MPSPRGRRTRTTLTLALTVPLAASLAFAACGPKAPRKAQPVAGATPAASPAPTELLWAADARAMLRIGLGAGRPAWGTPGMKPGERVAWFVTVEPPSTSMRRVIVARDAKEPARWHVARLPQAAMLDVALSADGSRAESIAWSTSGATPVVVSSSAGLASLWTPPLMFTDSSFSAAGGTFGGNEVVRVPAGVFRARHGILKRDGADWHLYVARGVPGGLVKVERFPEGSSAPSLVLELDGFTRLREPRPR